MGVRYRPVQWNRNKYVYDIVLIVLVVAYIWLFIMLAPDLLDFQRPVDRWIVRMRAFGTCAFLMLTLILCIGPMARLDRRWLPLLYNRRHFGVLTAFVAAAHLIAVLDWYHSFSPTAPWVSLLTSNTAYDSFAGFPFEALGLLAFGILLVMAATSHDFWLNFLGPPLWKGLHMLVYLAYAAVVMHVSLGLLQSEQHPFFVIMVAASLVAVIGLHLMAARKERRRENDTASVAEGDWIDAGPVGALEPDRGKVVALEDGERIALFRSGDKVGALANVCAHQNGPLGEGRIIDGCVTCPWHGFQYRLNDGCSPPPFTEKVATYRVRLAGDRVQIDRRPLPAGTPVDLATIPEDLR